MDEPDIWFQPPMAPGKPQRVHCDNCTADDILGAIAGGQGPYDIRAESFRGTTFPALPDTVTNLSIRHSPQITVIENFPASLEFLQISNIPTLNVQTLPPYPPTLRTLWLINCGLPQVPPFPDSLTSISFGGNAITELPSVWSPNLTSIDFTVNQIRTIPSLPPNLRVGFFSQNQLQKIPRIETITTPELVLDENPLVEPFATIYQEYTELRELAAVGQGTFEEADQYLKTATNMAYDKPAALQQRQLNLRRKAANLIRLRATVGHWSSLGPNIGSTLGRQITGKQGSLNQQLQTLYGQMPEKQPVGVTQQPYLPPHKQRQVNYQTRMRLRGLMREEENLQKQKKQGGKRKTRKRKTRKN